MVKSEVQNKKESSKMTREEKKKGFRIHRNVYCSVIGLLAVINLVFVPEFTWFVFPLIGWGAGLTLHYILAIKKDL